MKKEKKLIETNDEEKMKNKFKRFRKIFEFIEGLFIAVILIMVILLALLGIATLISEDKEEIIQEVETVNEDEEFSLVAIANDYLDEDINIEDENKATLVAGVKIMLAGLTYIVNIIMIHNLKNIFYIIETEGTPFVGKNVTYLNRVHNAVWLLWLFGGQWMSVGLVFVIVISAFIQILKYGCKLQQEVDETL